MDQEQRISQTLELIEERIREKLTVEELASSAYFSKFHYQRLFREVVGESVMRYVAGRRMALAAEELAGTDASVLDIALRYGYDSHEGFTRSFKAHMGMTPTEYRRSRAGEITKKGCKSMCETTSTKQEQAWKELTGQLQALADMAGDAAGHIRDFSCPVREAEGFYSQLWQAAGERTRQLADELSRALSDAGEMERKNESFAPRLALLRVMEDAALSAHVTAFQTGLTMARAMPAHREAYSEPCARLESLAQAAGSGSRRIAGLMGEMYGLMLREIRDAGQELLDKASEAGRKIVDGLPSELPYSYIAQGIGAVCTKLAVPAGEMAPNILEDCLTELDILSFSASIDLLRAPGHGELFSGMEGFRKAIEEARDFFGHLVMVPELPGPAAISPTLPVFYLRSELEKLGPHLEADKRDKLQGLLARLERDAEADTAWQELRREAEALGGMGAALLYICGHR